MIPARIQLAGIIPRPSARTRAPGEGPKRIFRAALVVGLTAWAFPAFAHPHVWIDAITTVVVAKGMVTGIKVEWVMDTFFSETLLKDFDLNKNHKFDKNEVADLEREAFSNTAKQSYFTFVKADGVIVKTQKPKEFNAWIDKDVAHYTFLIPFAKPVDPKASALTVTYYEDTYYIDVGPPKADAVRFEGDGSLSCTAHVAEDPKTLIYFDSVHPLMVSVHC